VTYSALAVLTGLTGMLLKNIDAVMIKMFLTVREVGIFQAYVNSSISIVLVLTGIFTVVFFPTSSQYRDKRSIFKRLSRLIPIIMLVGIPGLIISQLIFLSLYGREYPIDPLLLILFSLGSLVIFIFVIFARLMSAVGIPGMHVILASTILSSITNIMLNYYLIPVWELAGVVVATIFSYLVAFVVVVSRRRLFNRAQSSST
jgi:PST family polysaccharide transporter